MVIEALHSLFLRLRSLYCEQSDFVVQRISDVCGIFAHTSPCKCFINSLLSFRDVLKLLLDEFAGLNSTDF